MFFFFFFNDTATTEIYTLSLHDALPISVKGAPGAGGVHPWRSVASSWAGAMPGRPSRPCNPAGSVTLSLASMASVSLHHGEALTQSPARALARVDRKSVV